MGTTGAAGRRTQEERSAATRERLLAATVECLAELGYAGTTTTEISARAGVSRGAQLHHFPTREELVITAVDYLLEKRHHEFFDRFARRPPGAEPAIAAIDILWSMMSGPAFHAWLELAVAARTDATLRPVVQDLSRRFIETVENSFRQIFPTPAQPDPFHAAAPRLVFALLHGLALEETILPDADNANRILDVLHRLARLALPARPARKGDPES